MLVHSFLLMGWKKMFRSTISFDRRESDVCFEAGFTCVVVVVVVVVVVDDVLLLHFTCVLLRWKRCYFKCSCTLF